MITSDLLFENAKLLDYLRWNSFLSEKHKLFYVATPKVACTALKWWFAGLEGHTDTLRKITDSTETDPDLIIHDSYQKVAPNTTGLDANRLIRALTSDMYFRFAVVRNPYKRLFSAWQSKILLQDPLQIAPYIRSNFFNVPINNRADVASAFEKFLEYMLVHEAPNFLNIHWSTQKSLLRPDLIEFDYITKIENIQYLQSALSSHLGQNYSDPFAHRHINESLLPYSSSLISERSAELIARLHAVDFETFGYDTALPLGAEDLSDSQIDMAIHAIHLVRGRHQRFGELQAVLSTLVAAHEETQNALTSQVEELLAAKTWFSQQSTAWEKKAMEADARFTELSTAMQNIQAEKAWLAEQLTSHQILCSNLTHDAAAKTSLIEELQTGNDRLSQQSQTLEQKVIEADSQFAEQSAALQKMATEKAWLIEQLINHRLLCENLGNDMAAKTLWTEELQTANDWLSQQCQTLEQKVIEADSQFAEQSAALQKMATEKAWLIEQLINHRLLCENLGNDMAAKTLWTEELQTANHWHSQQRTAWQQKSEDLLRKALEQSTLIEAYEQKLKEIDAALKTPLMRYLIKFRISPLKEKYTS